MLVADALFYAAAGGVFLWGIVELRGFTDERDRAALFALRLPAMEAIEGC